MQIFLINGDPSRGRVFQKRNRFVLVRLDFNLPLAACLDLLSTNNSRTQIDRIDPHDLSRLLAAVNLIAQRHELFRRCVKRNRSNNRRYYRRVGSPENREEAENC